MYSPKVADHISNPRNIGELEHPSGIGDVTNEVCLDRIRLTVQIADGRVAAAKVKAEGCPPTIAAASVLTELIIGRAVADLPSMSRKDVIDALGRLPAAKMHCASLAIEALHAAVEDATA